MIGRVVAQVIEEVQVRVQAAAAEAAEVAVVPAMAQ